MARIAPSHVSLYSPVSWRCGAGDSDLCLPPKAINFLIVVRRVSTHCCSAQDIRHCDRDARGGNGNTQRNCHEDYGTVDRAAELLLRAGNGAEHHLLALPSDLRPEGVALGYAIQEAVSGAMGGIGG